MSLEALVTWPRWAVAVVDDPAEAGDVAESQVIASGWAVVASDRCR